MRSRQTDDGPTNLPTNRRTGGVRGKLHFQKMFWFFLTFFKFLEGMHLFHHSYPISLITLARICRSGVGWSIGPSVFHNCQKGFQFKLPWSNQSTFYFCKYCYNKNQKLLMECFICYSAYLRCGEGGGRSRNLFRVVKNITIKSYNSKTDYLIK